MSQETKNSDFDIEQPMPGSGMNREDTIDSLLPLVRHVVSRMAIFLPAFVSSDDLLSAGVVGLMQAVDRFDPLKGASLKTYCTIRIRGAVLDELRRLAGTSRSVFRETRELMEAQEVLAQKLGREPIEEEIMEHMGLQPEEFQSLIERVKPVSCFSLNQAAFDGDEPEPLMYEEILPDTKALTASENSLKHEDSKILTEQLNRLPKQQLQVLLLYYMEDLRLKEIAEVMGLTESRVSQIHTLAISRLRSTIEKIRRR